MSHPSREWIIAPPHPERERLAGEARISPVLAQILLNRGIGSAADVQRFFGPQFRELLPPDSLPNAVEAGRRLARAAQAGCRIVVYGDYDVDGVTATAILWWGLKLAGANVDYYVPSRLDEGYGLNADALRRIRAAGADVVVTVDCGVTAVEEARLAHELGLELIVTDHHEPGESLPDALLVHPTACGRASPNPHLSGAGVALKVAWALSMELSRAARVAEQFRDYLCDATAFAALGLVADVVPLVGENRLIASYGLKQLCHSRNPGLHALIEVSGLTGKRQYDDYHVGFLLAPRLNAVGRMGHAREAVELFTHADPERARQIAQNLDWQNRRRQSVEREIFKQAEALVIERGYHRDGCRAIVLASAKWHVGVIGIVAARLVDRFHRPTILIALENGEGQGSGRSIRNFPLHEALAACRQHLLSFGGHAAAAGVRVKAGQVAAFTDAFQAEAARRLTQSDLTPKLRLDDQVSLQALLPDLITPLQKMGPFGSGNPRPMLATADVELAAPPRVVGNGNHLQLAVRQAGGDGRVIVRKAIAFNRGKSAGEFNDHRCFRLAFEPIASEWNGSRSIELKVLDWKWAD